MYEIEQQVKTLLKAQEQKLLREANEHLERKRNLFAAKSDLEEELMNFHIFEKIFVPSLYISRLFFVRSFFAFINYTQKCD